MAIVSRTSSSGDAVASANGAEVDRRHLEVAGFAAGDPERLGARPPVVTVAGVPDDGTDALGQRCSGQRPARRRPPARSPRNDITTGWPPAARHRAGTKLPGAGRARRARPADRSRHRTSARRSSADAARRLEVPDEASLERAQQHEPGDDQRDGEQPGGEHGDADPHRAPQPAPATRRRRRSRRHAARSSTRR